MRFWVIALCLTVFSCTSIAQPDGYQTPEGSWRQVLFKSDSLRDSAPSKAKKMALRVYEASKGRTLDSVACAACKRIAQTSATLGDLDASISWSDTFLLRCGDQYPRLLLGVKINTASTYITLGNHQRAKSLLIESKRLAFEQNLFAEQIAISQTKARLFFIQRHFDSVYAQTLITIRLGRKHQSRALPNAFTTLALYFSQVGKHDSALHYNHLALVQARETGNRAYMMNSYLNLASAHGYLGAWDSSQQYLDSAKHWASKLSDHHVLITAGISEAYNLYDQGKYQAAFNKLDAATDLKDSLMTAERARDIADLEVRYETAEKEREIESLKTEKEIRKLRFGIWIGILIFFILGSSIFIYHLSKRRKQEKLLAESTIEKLEKQREVIALESMLYAQEEERQRIAKDLHDGIGALLSTARMQINKVESEINKLQNLDLVKNTEDIILRASKEVRRVSHNMMPGVLMEFGLVEAIKDFTDQVGNTLSVEFVSDDTLQRLPAEIEIMLFRIVQELINNSVKHAEARKVELSLAKKDETIELDYRDNGRGFDPEEWHDLSNLGLNSIRSRANFLKGKIILDTTPGNGTHYQLSIPYYHANA